MHHFQPMKDKPVPWKPDIQTLQVARRRLINSYDFNASEP